MGKTYKKIGQIPGSVVYTWDVKTAESLVTMVDYDDDRCDEKRVTEFHQCLDFDHYKVKRIDFIGVDQTNDIQEIGELFNLHPLTMEAIANIQQRPKYEDMGDYLFLSLKLFSYDKKKQVVKEEQISLVLGEKYVISFQEYEGNDEFNIIKERIRTSKGRIRKMRSDYLLYALLDIIVDRYFVVLEDIEDSVENLQDELLRCPNPKTLSKIEVFKQNLISLRKSIWPVREIVGALARTESELIDDGLQTYFRDIYDHTVQIIDTVETFRDIIAWSLDIYLSTLSNKMNEVMKVLTVISTIFIPLTFIAGVYGMNFKYMPELNQRWAYPLLWILMIVIAVGMLVYFKKRKWL